MEGYVTVQAMAANDMGRAITSGNTGSISTNNNKTITIFWDGRGISGFDWSVLGNVEPTDPSTAIRSWANGKNDQQIIKAINSQCYTTD